MNYLFDELIERKNTGCEKYDKPPYKNIAKDPVQLWVADMDFAAAPQILEALKKRLEHPILGYFSLTDAYYNAIIQWQKRRFAVEGLEKGHICFQSGVIAGVAHILDLYTEENDPVIVQTPCYPGFIGVLSSMKRKLVANPMINDKGYYSLDLEHLEKVIIENKAKLMIFCSPHNPTGRIWRAEELRAVADICIRHKVMIIVDEIWADMKINRQEKFLPFFEADPRLKEFAISLYSPSKGFNLAGMFSAYSVCYNEAINQKLEASSNKAHSNNPTVLSIESTIAAYKEGEEWLEACIDYIGQNMDYILDFLQTKLPKIKCRKPDATYLMWLDFSELALTHEEIMQRLVEKAGLIIVDGNSFGEGGEMKVRLNPSTPRANIVRAMDRLYEEFRDL